MKIKEGSRERIYDKHGIRSLRLRLREVISHLPAINIQYSPGILMEINDCEVILIAVTIFNASRKREQWEHLGDYFENSVESVYQRKSVHNRISNRMADVVDLARPKRHKSKLRSQRSISRMEGGGRAGGEGRRGAPRARVSNAQVS